MGSIKNLGVLDYADDMAMLEYTVDKIEGYLYPVHRYQYVVVYII